MSGLIEGLARRAAGLPPPPGVALARSRPRTLFEPGGFGVEVGAVPAIPVADVPARESADGDTVAGSPQPPRARPDPHPDDRSSRAHGTTMPNPSDAIAPVVNRIDEAIAGEATGRSVPNPAARVADPGVRQVGWPGRDSANNDPERADQAMPDGAPTRRPPVAPSPAVADLPRQTISPPSATSFRGESRTPPVDIAPTPIGTTTRLDIGRPGAPAGRAAPTSVDETRPSVSVSIGRIEIEVAPAANAAPTRAQAVRTRGFESYARARRGQPR